MKKDNPLTVLFLCTGNSCRSQMAEAIVNSDPNGNWYAYSAGTDPADMVHPLALHVLEEMGIAHQGEPNNVYEYIDHNFDLVITVCDDAAESCPIWLGKGTIIHKSILDPAKAEGTEQEILDTFRNIRDQIRLHIPKLLDDYNNKEVNDD